MNADDLRRELDAVDVVLAVHDAVVVDVACEDHDPHAVVVCDACGTVDVPNAEGAADDCPGVEHVRALLEARSEEPA